MNYLHDEYRTDVFAHAREILATIEQQKDVDMHDLREIVEELRELHNAAINMSWLKDIIYERDSDGSPIGVKAMKIVDCGGDGVIPKIMHGVMYPEEAFPDGYIHIGDLMRKKVDEIEREKQLIPWEVHPSIEEIGRRTEDGWLYTTGSGRRLRFTVPEESRTWTMTIEFNTPSQGFAGQILRYATGNNDLEWDSLI